MQSFSELPLSPALLRAVADLGYEKPSPIQAEALPILLGEATDFLGLAATGTGKTAAFGLPLIEKIDATNRSVQGLILCPTRELALQVSGQINLLGKHKGVRAVPVYGGASYGDQIRGLKQGAQVVVGTPGRVIDHLERGTLRFDGVQILILDEADEMISMGFQEDLETIMGKTPRETSHIWLFSATMDRDVRKVADKYLRQPKQVQINRTEMLSATVEQFYYMAKESDKAEILCKLIDSNEDFYGLVFCQTKALVTDLTAYLSNRGYKVDCLHGDKDQNSRERTMQAFRDHKVSMLVCTDVASRGLDVKGITHVINYSIPRELDSYVHRIGRTARSGKTGVAMSLVTPSHRDLIGRIERMTKSRMLEGKLPTRKEIGAKKISKVLTRFQDQKLFPRAVELMDAAWKEVLAGMSAEEVAGRFLAAMFPEVFAEQREPAKVLGQKAARAPEPFRASPRSSEQGPRRAPSSRAPDKWADKPAYKPAEKGPRKPVMDERPHATRPRRDDRLEERPSIRDAALARRHAPTAEPMAETPRPKADEPPVKAHGKKAGSHPPRMKASSTGPAKPYAPRRTAASKWDHAPRRPR